MAAAHPLVGSCDESGAPKGLLGARGVVVGLCAGECPQQLAVGPP